MRPEHAPDGDPCTRCGMAAARHRKRSRAAYRAERRAGGLDRDHGQNRGPRTGRQDFIIGIDGEGGGRKPHRYFYLAAAGEDDRVFDVEDQNGLTTEACLDFLVALPTVFTKLNRCLVFGYSLGYDYTKILGDLPDDKLYALFHEQDREKDGAFLPVYWKDYKLNYMNKRLSIAKGIWYETTTGRKFQAYQSVVVWDIFRFYQGPFVAALTDWKTGGQETIDWIRSMKEQRYKLDALPMSRVRRYCLDECRLLVKLGRQLLSAHKDAGLDLRHYFGAGSTGGAMLRKLGVKEYIEPTSIHIRLPVAKAFFGGRFENSVVGPIHTPIVNSDISSAYPYRIYSLPCLVHGRWEYVVSPSRRAIEAATLALLAVEWNCTGSTWGPFPIRQRDGTVLFPLSANRSQDCWVWKPEFLAAKSRWKSGVRASQAWLYTQECDHRPFQEIPAYYLERIRLGKDGPGIVLKLGMNSEYGKLAQSKGHNPPFQSWIWAGNITSGTRAQLLEVLPRDDHDVLSMATDGVTSLHALDYPTPIDTGTASTGKPLGGWETKTYEAGMFYARPGIYFPLDATADTLKEVRARGLGKKVVYECWREIVDAYSRDENYSVTGYNDGQRWITFERFIGAKTGVYKSGSEYKRSADYGEFVPWPIEVTFGPEPKRCRVDNGRLVPWSHVDGVAAPYNPATVSPEAQILRDFQEIVEEQPDLTYG